MDQKSSAEPPLLKVDESAAVPPQTRPDLASFPEIFQQHARFLWRALVNLGVPSHDAQDLCQEVMLIVHRRLPTFSGRSLRAWLYGICVRVASDYRRSARVRREIPHAELPDPGQDAPQPEALERHRRVARVLRALEELGDERRDAFVLYEVEELTLVEIAEALEVPLQTVYSRIKSARDALRERFRDDGVRQAKGGAREAG